MNRPVMVVHGGAWFVPEEEREEALAAVRRAAAAGWARLEAGASALDAVEAAIHILEDATVFDAGRGSYFNRAGHIEMDAMMMDGRTLNVGAVAAVHQIRHPITLARKVMAYPDFNFLVGEGAKDFAAEQGMRLCDPAELMGRRDSGGWSPPKPPPSDTVGAVAMDREGNLASGTSTGGTPNKRPGRVGDSPLVGSGGYADNLTGAASATGAGEALMRIVISKSACDLIAAGKSAQEAAAAVIRLLHERVYGYGGIILIDREGGVGLAHNTPNMSYAYRLPGEEIVAGVALK